MLASLDVAWRAGLRPEPTIRLSDWADEHRVLPPTASEPGKWRTSRTPYLREIMDCLSVGSPVERIVLLKSAQIGATECGLNWMGYVIANAPGLMLSVMPTTESARRNVRVRVDPLIESCPELRDRVVKARSRDPGNSQSMKVFPGGQVAFVGANSAVGLRSTPARYLFLDEIDAYPSDSSGEGDPVALALARTTTFRGRRKIFLCSTPTLAGVSRIEKAYLESDQRRYFVPCPHCGAHQVLVWERVRWDADDRAHAFYQCESCNGRIEERHKPEMLALGEWRASAQSDVAGFHLSALYSPFTTWREIAVEHGLVHRDPARLQAWTNLQLGLPFENLTALLPEPARLMARCEPFPLDGVPEGVVAITGGIDVQMDRIELEICGWGAGEESWSLDYKTLTGNPAEPDLWRRLDSILTARYGGLPVMAACIDAGNWSKQVYDYTGPRHHRRIWAIKGSSTRGAPLWPRRPSRPKAGRPPLYIIGSDAAKEIITARLSLEEPGPGTCHWPIGRDLDYFTMLTNEKPVVRYRNGVATREWMARGRNESLDTRVYALCALHGLRALGFDLNRTPELALLTRRPPMIVRSNTVR